MTIQDEIKALAFDVGGTVLDWHSGISAAARAACEAAAPDTDWPALANRWRLLQLQGMLGESMNGKTPDRFRGMNIDGVSRAVLDQVLEEFGLTQLDPAARDELSAAWHRLPAWPDSAPGHARLRRKFLMSTLTILSVSLIVDVSRLAPFLWDCVISCEMLGIYKTNPLVYRRGAELLNLAPEQILMVAAHNHDLQAAAREGYRTAFINRPAEWGVETPEPAAAADIDLVADGLEDLADQLGA